MIESDTDLSNFIENNIDGDLILHIIPSNPDCHPVGTSPSVLFIKNIKSRKTYYFSFNHPDSNPQISKSHVFQTLQSNKSKKWTIDKKTFDQLVEVNFDVYDVNYCKFVSENKIIEQFDYDTVAHESISRRILNNDLKNLYIPLLKHKQSFDEMSDEMIEVINNSKHGECEKNINKFIISSLASIEKNGIFVDKELFYNRFKINPNDNGLVYSQYNIYTSTGRPSNTFDGINYAALNHGDGSRKAFVSRHGDDGCMVLVDYSAFHPRIICNITNYDIPSEIDIYEYLAKLYFNKKCVDEIDIKNSKKITFLQLYGGVEEKYEHIKYLSNLKDFINEKWKEFKSNGYIKTPYFDREITSYHIKDPNPTKLFNYILQAAEGEIAIPKLAKVNAYLKDKKTKPVLYTYDSILYDFNKGDGIELLKEIVQIMSDNGKFPMKIYIGKSYQDLQLISS